MAWQRHSTAFSAPLLFVLLGLSGCGAPGKIGDGKDQPEPRADAGAGDKEPDFPETGINASTLTVTGVKPDSGPFSGGNRVVVRGSGFTDQALVFIGGSMVQPASTTLVDKNSLQVVVPAGRVGLADVTVQVDDREVTKEGAYTYNPLLLDPMSGSIAGGTSVLITAFGAPFDDGVRIEFAGQACSDLRVVTPSQVRCKTPAGKVGNADVTALWPDDATQPSWTAIDAFEYVDTKDTVSGGLNGGPLSGTLNVTVVDAMLGLAVQDAFVLIGDDLAGPYQGLTDARGQITFSGEDLAAPLTLHAAKKCMERQSIVSFDAQNVTLYMLPLPDPSCAEPGEPPPPGRGVAGSMISGELIFPGAIEFGINAWDVVPPPRPLEVRVAYVFTTRARIAWPNPSPSIEGTLARVLEDDSAAGAQGYPYSIFARPAGLAVYAISGLERTDTGEFIPYVMGVARDVLTAPGEETTGVDIHMDIPLDRELVAQIVDLPEGTPRGPDQFRIEAHIDLGGEGVIVRQVKGEMLDLLTSYTGGSDYRFFAQPALDGSLQDGRYQVIAGWFTGDREGATPYTQLRRLGVQQTSEPLLLDDLLAIPSVVTPLEGASLPDDRVLRWQIEGPDPDLLLVQLIGGDGLSAWMQIVRGDVRESTVPDFSGMAELVDIPAGIVTWTVQAIRIEDFEFNEFTYSMLSDRFWTHSSANTFTTQR